MSMFDHIKQQVVQEFFPTKVSFPGKGKTGFLFYQNGRSSKHMENMLHILSRGSVAHCFKLLHNVRYRATKRTASIGDRGSNPGSGSHSVFTFFYRVHMFSLSFFIC